MSVWYRFVLRICCFLVVGVHMATPGLVSEPPGITSIPTTQLLSKRPLRQKQGFCAFAGSDDCTIARAGLAGKNFYFLLLSETTLRLFASYGFLEEWFFVTFPLRSWAVFDGRERCRRAKFPPTLSLLAQGRSACLPSSSSALPG